MTGGSGPWGPGAAYPTGAPPLRGPSPDRLSSRLSRVSNHELSIRHRVIASPFSVSVAIPKDFSDIRAGFRSFAFSAAEEEEQGDTE